MVWAPSSMKAAPPRGISHKLRKLSPCDFSPSSQFMGLPAQCNQVAILQRQVRTLLNWANVVDFQPLIDQPPARQTIHTQVMVASLDLSPLLLPCVSALPLASPASCAVADRGTHIRMDAAMRSRETNHI